MTLASRGFTLAGKVMAGLARLLPDGKPDPLAHQRAELGRPADRLDEIGRAHV